MKSGRPCRSLTGLFCPHGSGCKSAGSPSTAGCTPTSWSRCSRAPVEGLRALGWEHVHLDPDAGLSYWEVWRSMLMATPKHESRAAPWPWPVSVSTHFELSGCSGRRSGWPRGSSGPRQDSCSQPGSALASTPPTSAVTFAAPWPGARAQGRVRPPVSARQCSSTPRGPDLIHRAGRGTPVAAAPAPWSNLPAYESTGSHHR